MEKIKVITKDNASKEELELMEALNFNTLHVKDKRDRCGRYFGIEEIRDYLYATTIKEYKKSLALYTKHYLFAKSKEALKMLKKVERRDNKHAEYLGLKQYKIIEVKQLSDGFIGVVLKFNDGTTRNFVESGLTYALKEKERLEEYVKRDRHYFTAGGLEDKDVDFIFDGVGHSTKKDLYSFEHMFEVIK